MNTTGTNKMMFFQNVCQFVRMIASPKQPQSDTGLLIASFKVMIVNPDMKTNNIQLVILILIPRSKFNPVTSSTVHSSIVSIRLKGLRKFK
jgi:hypothetical protein